MSEKDDHIDPVESLDEYLNDPEMIKLFDIMANPTKDIEEDSD